ncbi:GAF and ANTAR domain-containing protein [Blastococcus sp. PRF04-17]|uniref:GAF and ANTAR domain-containing protein n=1 Tax=Blastococcus sp. PRF04-17 TaxID=2933797 RepID=UPI001FF238CC|nr:GAF and ANTAR domain-containing protein [Blastococcus sp. PRF04-17]UOY03164.1 GAF and ANTAR domain-containing protein [Blastococcus sp. PRF04-17]
MVGDSSASDRAGRSEQSGSGQQSAPVIGDAGAGAGGAENNLGEIMGQLARSLQDEHGDVEGTLQTITSTAVGSIPGAEHCTISYVIGRHTVEPRAATGPLPQRIDEMQNRVREGPCLDAVWEHETVRIDDMRAEERWPQYTAEAAKLGVLSALSFQLFVTGDNLGALNLYAERPHAFHEGSEDVGLVFASHAAVALAGARHEANLQRAVSSRDVIGQAKGILMERFKLTADQAFAVLSRTSQETNRKLIDIARELAETGDLPHP